MNKILLALTILSASAGAFHTARHSTGRLQQEAQAVRESWLVQTQLLAAAQSEQAGLTERIRELKQALAQTRPVAENALWTVLRTNRADRLPPELRERLREELGFNWRSSPDFILVSKQAVRDLQMQAITQDGRLTDLAASVLALTPAERGQVEAAMERVKPDLKDWLLIHVERGEPTDEVLAKYTLPKNPAMSQSISNAFVTAALGALGRERVELILPTAQSWLKNIGINDSDAKPVTMIVKRYLAGDEQRLKAQTSVRGITNSGVLRQGPMFPAAFRPLFPNGWADVAEREGFELPKESQKK